MDLNTPWLVSGRVAFFNFQIEQRHIFYAYGPRMLRWCTLSKDEVRATTSLQQNDFFSDDIVDLE